MSKHEEVFDVDQPVISVKSCDKPIEAIHSFVKFKTTSLEQNEVKQEAAKVGQDSCEEQKGSKQEDEQHCELEDAHHGGQQEHRGAGHEHHDGRDTEQDWYFTS